MRGHKTTPLTPAIPGCRNAQRRGAEGRRRRSGTRRLWRLVPWRRLNLDAPLCMHGPMASARRVYLRVSKEGGPEWRVRLSIATLSEIGRAEGMGQDGVCHFQVRVSTSCPIDNAGSGRTTHCMKSTWV